MGAPARSFRDLVVWKRGHELALAVYRVTASFPVAERYGLAAQMRRAAVSIPANIAEGFARQGRADKGRFLNIAQGSLEELRYYFILAADLGYSSSTDVAVEADEVGRLLVAYRRSVLSSVD